MVALAYISVSRYVKEATSVAVSSNMYAPLNHVAAGMQAILTANHSAFVVADYLAASNRNHLSQVTALIFLCLFFGIACMTNVDAVSFPNTIF
jgi:hypothetical protein